MEVGADPNITNSKGETALDLASGNQNIALLIRVLLEKSEKSRRSTIDGGAMHGSVSSYDKARRSVH